MAQAETAASLRRKAIGFTGSAVAFTAITVPLLTISARAAYTNAEFYRLLVLLFADMLVWLVAGYFTIQWRRAKSAGSPATPR